MAEPNEADEPKTQQTQPKGIDPKTGKPYEPVEIPVPKRADFDRLLRRAEAIPQDELIKDQGDAFDA
jgi:hypothetical protein